MGWEGEGKGWKGDCGRRRGREGEGKERVLGVEWYFSLEVGAKSNFSWPNSNTLSFIQ